MLFAYHFAIDLNFGLSIAWFIDSPAARNATGLILALSLLFSLALLLASEKMGIGMNEKVILFVLLASILCITALLALPNHAAWIAWSVLFSVCVLGRANNLRSGGRSTAQNKLNGMFVAASHRLVSGVAILVGLVYGAAFGFDETATNAILVVVSLVSVACTAAILLHTRNMEIDLSNEEAIKKLVGIVAEQYDLTAREKEIVFYLAQNIGGNELAEKLYLSPHTVKAHTANIYKKLSVHSRNELISLVLDIEKA